MDSTWIAERLQILVTRYEAGNGATAIARELGLRSRGAVMGKLNRLGLLGKKRDFQMVEEKPKKPKAAAPRAPANYNPKAAKAKKSIATTEAARIKQEKFTVLAKTGAALEKFPWASTGVSFMDLKPNQCRWPCASEGVATHFCGKPQLAKSSYCAEHSALAWTAQSYKLRLAQERAAKQFRSTSRPIAGESGACAADLAAR